MNVGGDRHLLMIGMIMEDVIPNLVYIEESKFTVWACVHIVLIGHVNHAAEQCGDR